jgi:hypothetical protein
VRWHLHYPAASIADLHVLRRHYEALRVDQHVAEVSITGLFGNPQVRVMEVVFHDGWDNPLIPELYFLPQRYPRRDFSTEPFAYVPGIQLVDPPNVSPVDAQHIMDALRSGPHVTGLIPDGAFDFIYANVSPAPSLEPVRLPEWVKVGQWVRTVHGLNEGLVFRIEGLTRTNTWTFVQAHFHNTPEGETAVVTLDAVLQDCVPTTEPPKRLNAWQRLLGGLDEKE